VHCCFQVLHLLSDFRSPFFNVKFYTFFLQDSLCLTPIWSWKRCHQRNILWRPFSSIWTSSTYLLSCLKSWIRLTVDRSISISTTTKILHVISSLRVECLFVLDVRRLKYILPGRKWMNKYCIILCQAIKSFYRVWLTLSFWIQSWIDCLPILSLDLSKKPDHFILLKHYRSVSIKQFGFSKIKESNQPGLIQYVWILHKHWVW